MGLIMQNTRVMESGDFHSDFTRRPERPSKRKCVTESQSLPGAHEKAMCEGLRAKPKVYWRPTELETQECGKSDGKKAAGQSKGRPQGLQPERS